MGKAMDRDGRPLAQQLRDSAETIRMRLREKHDPPIPTWTLPDLVSLLQDAAEAVEISDRITERYSGALSALAEGEHG